MTCRRIILLTAALVALAIARPAPAEGAVSVEAPPVVFPGIVFSIRIVVEYERDHGTIALPAVDGLATSRGQSGTQTSMSTINGRMTLVRSMTVSYSARIDQEGSVVIPSFTVQVDGNRLSTEPVTIRARESDPGELGLATVRADRSVYYLGETLPVTLEVLIKIYRDREIPYDWSPEDSWGSIQIASSAWGPVAAAVNALRNPFGQYALPAVDVVERIGDGGEPAAYHRFSLQVSHEPIAAGSLGFENVAIQVVYPRRLGRTRLRSLRIVETEKFILRPETLDITVREPPAAGQPAFYAGAVGHYVISTRAASTTNVAVGDPIELEIVLIDRTPGTRSLENLQAPKLVRVDELMNDFQVANASPTGVVEGRRKIFRQTIRPRRDDVRAIPQIPLAFYDPDADAYTIVRSNPIPVSVEPAITMAMSEVEGAEAALDDVGSQLTRIEGGILANDVAASLASSRRPFEFGAMHGAVALFGPLGFVAAIAVRRHQSRRADVTGARRRGAMARARRRLRGDDADVTAALCDFVADRCGRAEGSMTPAEVDGALERAGVDDDLRRETADVLRRAEAARYGGGGAGGAPLELSDRADALIGRLGKAPVE